MSEADELQVGTDRPLVLVTGGGRRLGRRLALALGSEGYNVAISFFRSEAGAHEVVDQLEELGARAAAFECDLSQGAEAAELIDRVESEMGDLSLLVNSAGVFPHSPVESADLAAFDATIAVNLRAPYLLSLEAGRRMKERGEGSIVNIASVGGIRPYAQHLPYSASKAGLIMLTRSLALGLAPEVTVNAVAPGTIWMDGEEEGAAAKPPQASIPLGCYGESADIEEAVSFLAGAPFITGQVIVVDGGASLQGEYP